MRGIFEAENRERVAAFRKETADRLNLFSAMLQEVEAVVSAKVAYLEGLIRILKTRYSILWSTIFSAFVYVTITLCAVSPGVV